MRKFTEKGRVVYNRKKHLWTTKDLIRIGENLGATFFRISGRSWKGVIQNVSETLDRSYASDFTFGLGEFGGGGATRYFGEERVAEKSGLGRVIIIVETD